MRHRKKKGSHLCTLGTKPLPLNKNIKKTNKKMLEHESNTNIKNV